MSRCRSTPLTMFVMKKRVVWFSISMHAYGCFYSYGALICDSHRVLLENNNILTWLQSFQVKIENFFKFLLSLNPYRYQIDAYRAGYKTRDQEF